MGGGSLQDHTQTPARGGTGTWQSLSASARPLHPPSHLGLDMNVHLQELIPEIPVVRVSLLVTGAA